MKPSELDRAPLDEGPRDQSLITIEKLRYMLDYSKSSTIATVLAPLLCIPLYWDDAAPLPLSAWFAAMALTVITRYALLRSMPALDWLPSADRFDAILSANLDRAVRALAVPGMGQLGMFWEGDAYDSAPNPTFWPSIRTGQRPGVYTGMIVNYIAFNHYFYLA